MQRSTTSLFLVCAAVATAHAAFASGTIDIGGTRVTDGVLDASTLTYETHRALASMLGMRNQRLEADLKVSPTGDVFTDARTEKERLARVLGYVEQFHAIQNEYGYIAIELPNLPVFANQPRLNAMFDYYNGAQVDFHGQSICGLPMHIGLFRSEIDPSPNRIVFGYPKMDWVSFPTCSDRGAYYFLNMGGEESIRVSTDSSLNYLFNDLDIGEAMYRKLSQGASADVRCAVNAITDEPAVHLVCNLNSLSIKAGGELVYQINWSETKYVETWTSINPVPNFPR